MWCRVLLSAFPRWPFVWFPFVSLVPSLLVLNEAPKKTSAFGARRENPHLGFLVSKGGSGLMRSEPDGLQAPTTTSPLCYRGLQHLCFLSTVKKKSATTVRLVCLVSRAAQLSVLSQWCHGRSGLEPSSSGDFSVVDFWECW